jgi:hypothetical protein
MTTQHTPDPWAVHPLNGRVIVDSSGAAIVQLLLPDGGSLESRPLAKANARRIVACVNACAGMKNPSAEINRMKCAVIESVDHYTEVEEQLAKAEQQHAELLSALHDISHIASAKENWVHAELARCGFIASEAIAKAGGKV